MEILNQTEIMKDIISEDVNFVGFNQKYKIVKQDGKIYTVILREDKEK